MADIVKVDFYGDSVECARDDRGTYWVVLAPICARLGGLDVATQVKKLRDISHMARVSKTPTLKPDGHVFEQWAVDLDGVAAWLMSISLNRVSKEVRPSLERYQRDCARVLRDHLLGAPKEATAPTPPAPSVRQLPERAAICFEAARYFAEGNTVALYGPDIARIKAEHAVAKAMGEEPAEVAPRMLTTSEYLERKGLRRAEVDALAPEFGKVVKAAYVARHGKAPPQVDRFVKGTTRKVFGYTEADSPLFDEAFALMAAPAAAGGSR